MNYIKVNASTVLVNAPKSADFFDFVFDFQKSKHGKNFGFRKIRKFMKSNCRQKFDMKTAGKCLEEKEMVRCF